VPGLEADITVEDIGDASAHVTADVNDAYRTKYGRYAARIVNSVLSPAARSATLELVPA
jgi:hypothetical protein